MLSEDSFSKSNFQEAYPQLTKSRSINFFLVRHAESEANAQQLIQGWGNSPLTSAGRDQALELRNELGIALTNNIDMVFSSPLYRSVETAQIVLRDCFDWNKIILLEELREVNVGVLEGKPRDNLDNEEQAMWKSFLFDPFYSSHLGESTMDFKKRVEMSWKNILKFSIGKNSENVLVFTHGGYIRNVLLLLGEVELNLPNASFIKINYKDGKFEIG